MISVIPFHKDCTLHDTTMLCTGVCGLKIIKIYFLFAFCRVAEKMNSLVNLIYLQGQLFYILLTIFKLKFK